LLCFDTSQPDLSKEKARKKKCVFLKSVLKKQIKSQEKAFKKAKKAKFLTTG